MAFLHTSVLFKSLFLIPHPTPTMWRMLISCNSLACKFGVLRGLFTGTDKWKDARTSSQYNEKTIPFPSLLLQERDTQPTGTLPQDTFPHSQILLGSGSVLEKNHQFLPLRQVRLADNLQIACFSSWHPLFSWPGSTHSLLWRST